MESATKLNILLLHLVSQPEININLGDNEGRTPLYVAARSGHVDADVKARISGDDDEDEDDDEEEEDEDDDDDEEEDK